MGESQITGIGQLWEQQLRNDPDRIIFKVGNVNSSSTAYRVSTFLKRANKIANGFIQDLRLPPASRVMILSDNPNDCLLLAHGLWMANLTPFFVDPATSESELINYISEFEIGVVIFPPESAARIVNIAQSSSKAQHWITTGTAAYGSGSKIKRLDEISARADSDFPKFSPKAGELPGLITLTSGCSGARKPCLFDQQSIIKSARMLGDWYQKLPGGEEELSWCGTPWTHLDGLIHSFLLPLFDSCPAYIAPELDMKYFWDQAYADKFCHVMLTQDQLREVQRKGKSRTWLKPDNLAILVKTRGCYSGSLLKSFEERFRTPVFSCYSVTEAGGIVTVMPADSSASLKEECLYDSDFPSSGPAQSDAEFRVSTVTGDILGEEYLGKISVRTSRMMLGYLGQYAKAKPFNAKNFFPTGDEGFFASDEKGQAHLFVEARASEIIQRGEERIAPDRITNVLTDIKGIEFARTIGFPNAATGYEIGAYVIPVKAANLTEDRILAMLKAALDWVECPKVVVFGERGEDGEDPSEQEMRRRFERYFDTDYNLRRYQ